MLSTKLILLAVGFVASALANALATITTAESTSTTTVTIRLASTVTTTLAASTLVTTTTSAICSTCPYTRLAPTTCAPQGYYYELFIPCTITYTGTGTMMFALSTAKPNAAARVNNPFQQVVGLLRG